LRPDTLRRILGLKREKLAGSWRRLHNEELNNLHASPNIIMTPESRSMRWAEHIARVEQMRNAYNILVGMPERKKLLGRSRRRWEDNIRVDLMEMGWEFVDWLHLAQGKDQWRALVSTGP
jgi:hypothetical protein